MRQGEPGEHFYAVANGRFEVEKDGEHRRHREAGGFFGELALLHDAPRAATVRAATPARLFRLDRAAFDQLWPARSGAARSGSMPRPNGSWAGPEGV